VGVQPLTALQIDPIAAGPGRRARPRRKRALLAGGLAYLLAVGFGSLAGAAFAAPRPEFLPLDLLDSERAEAQRREVMELARRHIGPPLTRGLEDLRILQTIVDRELLESDDTFALQALGVVLGDVMVEQLPLEWVIVKDEHGRSRAVRYRDTIHVFFPVTMISRRLEGGAAVDVQALYDGVAERVAELERKRKARR